MFKGENKNINISVSKNSPVNASLTDPEYRKEEYNGKNFGNVALVMSLSAVPYENDGMYYKFVAKVFEYQEHLWFYNN